MRDHGFSSSIFWPVIVIQESVNLMQCKARSCKEPFAIDAAHFLFSHETPFLILQPRSRISMGTNNPHLC